MRKTNFFTKIVGITTVVCSLFGFSASAQTIATDPVSSPFCAGSTFDVTYTSMGFSGQQIYFAELSDSTGTFGMNGMMDAIGTDMMGMGTVSVTIPDSVGSGIHYRIRVSAMDVQNFTTVNGTDNGMDIVINEIPKTNATASSMSLCLGMTDTLMANATGGATPYSYAWSPGSHADSDTAYFTPSTSGLKGWSVVVTDSNSCMSKSDTVWVTVNDLPMVSIMASAMTICAGTADTLMAMATGGAGEYSSYWWGPADSTTTDTAFIVMPMMGGSIDYSVVVIDTNNCASMPDTATVWVNEMPSVSISASASLLCLGATDTLIATATGGASPYMYSWMPGTHADSDTAYFTPSTVGNKAWSVMVTDTNNCMSMVDTMWVAVDTINNTITMTGDSLWVALDTNATYQWINCANDSAIAGETSNVFIPSANGDYAVVVWVATCADTATCYSVTTTGVVSKSLESTVAVYPNPFSSQTTIRFGEAQNNASVKIVDMFGKQVRNYSFSGTQLTVEKGDMAPGVYFIQMNTNKGLVSKKIVVNQ